VNPNKKCALNKKKLKMLYNRTHVKFLVTAPGYTVKISGLCRHDDSRNRKGCHED